MKLLTRVRRAVRLGSCHLSGWVAAPPPRVCRRDVSAQKFSHEHATEDCMRYDPRASASVSNLVDIFGLGDLDDAEMLGNDSRLFHHRRPARPPRPILGRSLDGSGGMKDVLLVAFDSEHDPRADGGGHFRNRELPGAVGVSILDTRIFYHALKNGRPLDTVVKSHCLVINEGSHRRSSFGPCHHLTAEEFPCWFDDVCAGGRDWVLLARNIEREASVLRRLDVPAESAMAHIDAGRLQAKFLTVAVLGVVESAVELGLLGSRLDGIIKLVGLYKSSVALRSHLLIKVTIMVLLRYALMQIGQKLSSPLGGGGTFSTAVFPLPPGGSRNDPTRFLDALEGASAFVPTLRGLAALGRSRTAAEACDGEGPSVFPVESPHIGSLPAAHGMSDGAFSGSGEGEKHTPGSTPKSLVAEGVRLGVTGDAHGIRVDTAPPDLETGMEQETKAGSDYELNAGTDNIGQTPGGRRNPARRNLAGKYEAECVEDNGVSQQRFSSEGGGGGVQGEEGEIGIFRHGAVPLDTKATGRELAAAAASGRPTNPKSGLPETMTNQAGKPALATGSKKRTEGDTFSPFTKPLVDFLHDPDPSVSRMHSASGEEDGIPNNKHRSPTVSSVSAGYGHDGIPMGEFRERPREASATALPENGDSVPEVMSNPVAGRARSGSTSIQEIATDLPIQIWAPKVKARLIVDRQSSLLDARSEARAGIKLKTARLPLAKPPAAHVNKGRGQQGDGSGAPELGIALESDEPRQPERNTNPLRTLRDLENSRRGPGPPNGGGVESPSTAEPDADETPRPIVRGSGRSISRSTVSPRIDARTRTRSISEHAEIKGDTESPQQRIVKLVKRALDPSPATTATTEAPAMPVFTRRMNSPPLDDNQDPYPTASSERRRRAQAEAVLEAAGLSK